MFLRSLQGVAAVIDRPLTEQTHAALQAALRYFREAAPKHTADEEESLFPRLRQLVHPEIQSAIERLEPLERDHLVAGALHARVDELGQKCLTEGSLPTDEVLVFRESVEKLASIYQQHIQVEDSLVFPLAKQALSSSQKESIAKEMAARRLITAVAKD
jgi:hemerythrin-like domain-containing protein